jgi:hypothetical protein
VAVIVIRLDRGPAEKLEIEDEDDDDHDDGWWGRRKLSLLTLALPSTLTLPHDPQSSNKPGRHFLQIPGPTNVPERILRAIDRPTIDHRGKEFAHLGRECLEGMKPIFNTTRGGDVRSQRNIDRA